MGHSIKAGADALVMDENDHVATVLKDLKRGEAIRFSVGVRPEELVLLDDIPFGHKVAISPIDAGMAVRKYGEVIGRATAGIEPGRHVHVHNLEGIRGRGDQARQGGA